MILHDTTWLALRLWKDPHAHMACVPHRSTISAVQPFSPVAVLENSNMPLGAGGRTLHPIRGELWGTGGFRRFPLGFPKRGSANHPSCWSFEIWAETLIFRNSHTSGSRTFPAVSTIFHLKFHNSFTILHIGSHLDLVVPN